jgi:hypothetical protein
VWQGEKMIKIEVRRQSWLKDVYFIGILFMGDMVCLGLTERPIIWLTRIGYLYLLFDRSTRWYTLLLLGALILLVAASRSEPLDYEFMILVLWYIAGRAVRSWVQFSLLSWLCMVIIFVVMQHVFLEELGGDYSLLRWTMRLIIVTLLSSSFCLWLGRKVGRAIA